jgi:RimJ/RimL family protein N-acetyltransferase
MQLIGKKCILQRIQEEWITNEYIEGLDDEEVVRYAGYVKTTCHSIETAKKYISDLNNNPNVRLFGIYNKEYDHIGNIRLDIEWMWRNSIVSILIFNKKFWGKGIGTEAIELITDFAFNTLGMHRCEAGVLYGNIASHKAFEKAGYKYEGSRRERRFFDGRYVDERMFGKIKED